MSTENLNILNTEGVKLSFQESGTGSTVILVHGTASDSRSWGFQVEPLSKHFRTVSYCRRCAYPNQDRDFANSTVENNAKDLVVLIKKAGGAPVNLIGHSYGGATAAFCALKQPELVRNLVLIEPYLPSILGDPKSAVQSLSLLLRKPSVARDAQKALKTGEAIIQELDRKNFDKALQMFYDLLWDRPEVELPLPERARIMMLDNIETIRELNAKPPIFTKEEARRISQPTLLLNGNLSSKFLTGIVEELHDTIPNNQVITIQDAGHILQSEKPQECNEAILKFLMEHAS